MDGDRQREALAGSRTRAYIRWKALEDSDQGLSQVGRITIIEDLLNGGDPQAMAEFVDSMAGLTVKLLTMMHDGDVAAVADEIEKMRIAQ